MEHEIRLGSLDLSGLPPVFLIPAHLSLSTLHEWEDQLVGRGAQVTYSVHEAQLFFGKVRSPQRAEFELRSRGLWTEKRQSHSTEKRVPSPEGLTQTRAAKRRKGEMKPWTRPAERSEIVIDDSSTDSETNLAEPSKPKKTSASAGGPQRDAALPVVSTQRLLVPMNDADDIVRVMNLDWLTQCVSDGTVIPIDRYVVYEGQRIPRPANVATPKLPRPDALSTTSESTGPARRKSPALRKGAFKDILERVKADAAFASPGRAGRPQHEGTRRSHAPSHNLGQPHAPPPRLVKQNTSEHDEMTGADLPAMPLWVQQGKKYACQRASPLNSPNDAFMEQLTKIKLARLMNGDEIGVRAYSTSIAALAAYPHTLTSGREILALPGCDMKIAHLFHEWKTNDGVIQEVSEIDHDARLKVLCLFYDIWGVGAITAREFYSKGWRDLDDIIEHGWHTLTRVQQIGVKFYDEFLEKIPRQEVDFIAAKVTEHAKRVRDDGIEACIVGGYRRGKSGSGDVDIILSHRDLGPTVDLAQDVVASLEEEGWISHTLLLTLTNSHRAQQPLKFRAGGGGHGFDTLDKGLVVWQDPNVAPAAADTITTTSSTSPTSPTAPSAPPSPASNTNIHRRVDIIISPWRTVGCAIVGWSGGTTFQRDLRRYAKNVKGWKFDSSGVRDRATGNVVDLEGVGGVSKTWMEAERKVFEGFGLEYQEPWNRCTG
ncbi:MAG: hypothetical protein M1838_002818 [Thelocarpon superellum]|nr:MAG: hypothetical protein M1838_002818 [Thelocarpon superellum]